MVRLPGCGGNLPYWCALLCLLPWLPSTGGLHCLCSNCEEGICQAHEGACFVQFVESELQRERGCVDTEAVFETCVDQSDPSIVCCYSDECNRWSTGHNRQARISEKNKTGMESGESSTTSDHTLERIAIVSGAVCTLFMIAAISVVISFLCCHYRRRDRRTGDVECPDSSPSPVTSVGPVAFQPQGISLDRLSTSSAHPLSSLQQRHIVQHTTLEKSLCKGRFCDTYIGLWRRDKVMVKVFAEKGEQIWFSESKMHQLPHMRHDNIHRFYATDNVPSTRDSTYSSHHHFIVLEYHRHGSLHEYLQKTVLHPYHVVTFAMSIADGLAFLHSEISDESGKKPSMAHRNISSESIYVKSNGTCCISDFSLAVTSGDSDADHTHRPEPDYRYLAPEFLAEPAATPSLENLKKADMYSYGLVLWEIARRCTVLGMVEDVCLPYSSVLQHVPVQREEMKELVVSRDLRPPVPDQWNRDENMRIILRTITECWHGNSTVRLTPLRVKKTLLKLSQQIQPRMYDKNGKLLSIDRTVAMATMASGSSDVVQT